MGPILVSYKQRRLDALVVGRNGELRLDTVFFQVIFYRKQENFRNNK